MSSLRCTRPCKRLEASISVLRQAHSLLPRHSLCHRRYSAPAHDGHQKEVRLTTTTSPGRRSKRRLLLPSIVAVAAAGFAAFYVTSNSTLASKEIFDPPRFTPFTIVKREEVSPTSIVLTLRPQKYVNRPRTLTSDPYQQSWQVGTWSVEIKQPELQIARSYTPLPPTKGDPSADLRILVRKEYKGEVSGYLHKLAAGSELHLRGPHQEFNLSEDVSDVVFLAGGTGIAPAMQLAYSLFEGKVLESDKPKMQIVWSNRKRADCEGGADASNPYAWESKKTGRIVQELELLQQRYPGRLSVDYLVDEEKKFLDQKKMVQLTRPTSRVKAGAVQSKTDTKLLFVSGPPGFVDYIAGPKKWDSSAPEDQGELGGLLGKMGLRSWKVWKL